MVNSAGLLIRHEARTPAGAKALEHYARAVDRMKERDDDPADRTSWAYQAAIHGTYAKAVQELWNQCEHQSWVFLPWHRMYLYYFEQIVRKAVIEGGGPADWALPYWNYCLGGDHASLPEQFRAPADEENPLFAEREPFYAQGGRLLDKFTDPANALKQTTYVGTAKFGGGPGPAKEPRFWGQPGLLERTPHNDVHSQLGGLMRDSETAAQDPIFWVHHCNIDRLWAVWNEGNGGENPDAGQWLDHCFGFFDGEGEKVSRSCREVQETAQLGYTYEPSPATTTVEEAMLAPPLSDASPPSEPRFVGASEETVQLTGEPVEVPVAIDMRGGQEVLEAAAPEVPSHVYLNIEDIEGAENPSTVYGVYLNPPQGSSEDHDRHYVGNLSFFGIEKSAAPLGDKPPHGMRASFEVGPLVRALSEEGVWDQDRLRVRFAPLIPEPLEEVEAEPPGSGEHEAIRIGRVSLSIDA
jgi:tyrosinase